MKYYNVATLFVVACMAMGIERLYGQDLPSIQTDRPDQTECPFIVPKNYVQMENGLTFEHTNKLLRSFSLPTMLTKFGVNDHFELRLITEYSMLQTDGIKTSGLVPITAGFKVNIAQEKGILPTTSFIGHLTFPRLASEPFRSDFVAPSFRFTMQHSLSKTFTLGYNLGAEWDGQLPAPTYIYTLTLGRSISEKFSSYIEVYGFLPEASKGDHRFDGGISYLITPNILIDISGGFGITDNAPKHYAALGLSYRWKN